MGAGALRGAQGVGRWRKKGLLLRRLGCGRESVGCTEGWAVSLGYDLQPLA